MASTPQNVTPIASPPTVELVTKMILTVTGLNAQAFSGAQNPSTIYRQMVANYPTVYPYYREVEEKDTAISAALDTRKLLVRSRDARVQAADPNNGQARLYADALAAFLDSIPRFKFARWELLDAPAYGVSVTEILWSMDAGGIRARIIGRPQELFSFGRLTEPQTGELRLATFPGGEGQAVPLNKFLVNTYKPRHGDRRGLPLLRRLYWPSWFKRNALRIMLKYLEKGDGTVVVKYPTNASDDDKDKALEAAFAIAQEIASAVPETFSLLEGSGLTTQRGRTGTDFKDMFTYFDDEMTRMVLGQTQTTRVGEGGSGTQALGRVHENLMWELVRDDAEDEEFVINEQLAGPWLTWTFGPQALDRAVRPWWTVDKEPPKDRVQELDILARARNLGASRIPEEEVYLRGGIRQAEGDEARLPPPMISPDLVPPTQEIPEG